MIHNRYVVVKLIGRGTYSTCWLARDCKLELYVALKVYRGAPYYREVAIQEFDRHFSMNKTQLETRQAGGKPYPVVRLFDMFLLNGWIGSHVCLVFELLGDSLAHLLDFYKDELVCAADPGFAGGPPSGPLQHHPVRGGRAPGRPGPLGHKGAELPTLAASPDNGSRRLTKEKVVEAELASDHMMHKMLLFRFLDRKRSKQAVVSKANKALKGGFLSKKERKKQKKKNKKIQKTQKKREFSEIVQQLKAESQHLKRIAAVPLRTLRASKWAYYSQEIKRSLSQQKYLTKDSKLASRYKERERSRSPENFQPTSEYRRSYSEGGTLSSPRRARRSRRRPPDLLQERPDARDIERWPLRAQAAGVRELLDFFQRGPAEGRRQDQPAA